METLPNKKTPEEELAEATKHLDELLDEYYQIKHRFKYGSSLNYRIHLHGLINDTKKHIKELKEKINDRQREDSENL